MRALRWIFRLITQNLGWKLLSLAIAAALWMLVASEPELATYYATARLEYANLPSDLEISSAPITNITLELRGTPGELGNMGTRAQPAVVLDMDGLEPGIHTFPIGDGNVRLSRGVHLMRAMPSEVRLEFEHPLTRTVPVEVAISGENRSYAVQSKQAHPAALTIAGPASHVQAMRAVMTDPVDISSVAGSSEFRVNVYVQDPYVRFVSSPQVTVTVNMKKR